MAAGTSKNPTSSAGFAKKNKHFPSQTPIFASLDITLTMNPETDYVTLNRAAWNLRTEAHVDSEFYDVAGFLGGKTSLPSIDQGLLGTDLHGKSLLHLQCHFGQDTLSIARLGAQVTGLDLSDRAIAAARDLAQKANLPAEFICCDLYQAPQHLTQQYDIVYTSYGTIGWLPDLDKWAAVIKHALKPGGKFIFVEFHPVVWTWDDDFTHFKYRYAKSAPIVEQQKGTYAERDAQINFTDVSWNHSLSEVIQALLDQGLRLQQFTEYDYSPYDCFNHTIEFAPGQYRIRHLGDKMPMTYSLVAVK